MFTPRLMLQTVSAVPHTCHTVQPAVDGGARLTTLLYSISDEYSTNGADNEGVHVSTEAKRREFADNRERKAMYL